MPGTTTTPDIEIIVEDIGGGGGGLPPSFGGGDEGDGGDDGDGRRSWSASPKRYSTAIAIGLVSILMFFMALASAFIVLRRGSGVWITVHLPFVVWPNTCVLLTSSFTLEAARRRLFLADLRGFRKFWLFTTVLGFLFVVGQFSRVPTRCIFSVEFLRCFTFWRTSLKRQVFRVQLPRRLLPTTGISWMGCGFSCWRCFTWASESRISEPNISKIL